MNITVAALLLALGGLQVAGAGTLELLTPAEAALPGARSFGFSESLPSDGPEIEAKDLEVGEGGRPFPLVIRFAAKPGHEVDPSSLKLVCLKSTQIDLTPRVKPYADKEGVKMESVSLPPGIYRFRVAIGDVKGRWSEKDFTVKVSVIF